jgi:Fe-Mn family superoxide dismutase
MLKSHHENNYGGAIKNLNKVELELAMVGKDTPPFLVAGLRQSELQFRNSAALHELYFGNLGGDGKAGGGIATDVAAAFGSAARFDEQFRQAAAGLYGGSGWVTLGLDTASRALTITASQNHTQASVATLPLLVMDMYEHSYQMDFGAAAARYVDAFMDNVAWDEVDRRHQKARQVLALLGP